MTPNFAWSLSSFPLSDLLACHFSRVQALLMPFGPLYAFSCPRRLPRLALSGFSTARRPQIFCIPFFFQGAFIAGSRSLSFWLFSLRFPDLYGFFGNLDLLTCPGLSDPSRPELSNVGELRGVFLVMFIHRWV